MTTRGEIERLLAAFTAGGYPCFYAPLGYAVVSEYRAQLTNPGYIRLIVNINRNMLDRMVLTTCSDKVQAYQMTWSVVHKNYLDAMDILEDWIGQVYVAANGGFGQQGQMPSTYQGIKFMTFQPASGRFSPTCRPVGSSTAGGTLWAAETPMELTWEAAP